MIRFNCLLWLVFLLGGLPLYGQAPAPIDSLLSACNAYPKKDTIKVKMLNSLAAAYQKFAPEKGLAAAEEAIGIAEHLNAPWHLAEAWNRKAINLSVGGNLTDAIAGFRQAHHFFEAAGDLKQAASMLNSLGGTYMYNQDIAQGLIYFEKALAAQESLGDKVGQAKTLGNLGNVASIKDDYPKALEYYTRAAIVLEELGTPPSLGMVMVNKGTTLTQLGRYPEAIESILKGTHIFQQTGSKMLEARSLHVLAGVYASLSDYPNALEYNRRAFILFKGLGDQRSMLQTRVNDGSYYVSLKNYPLAMETYQDILTTLESNPDPVSKAVCYDGMGVIYSKNADYAKSIPYFIKAIEIEQALDAKFDLAKTYSKIGHDYLYAPDSVLLQNDLQPSQRYNIAKQQFLTGLEMSEALGSPAISVNIWQSLSELYEKTGEYVQSYNAFKKYIQIRDSIAGEAVKNQITRKEIQFEYDKKEAILKLEQQLTLEQLQQQKLRSFQQQQALKINQQALHLSNQEKDLQRLAYLKEKAEKQEKEQQLSLAEKEKQLQEVQLGSLLQEKALQLKTLAQKNALIVGLIAGILAIMLGFVAFYWWIRQKQAKKEAEVQAQFTRQLLENIEGDRGRIAIDLHDSVSHDLLLLKQSIRKELTGPEVDNKIDDIINGIRQISRNLHPVMLDKIGLRLSLETLCEQFMLHETMYVSHEIDYQNTLPKSAELQVFRMVQEGLTNAMKYAKAEAVNVQIKKSGKTLRLDIQDNGIGFDVEKALEGGKAFGLHSILQRAKAIGGHGEIRSGKDGTTISVVFG